MKRLPSIYRTQFHWPRRENLLALVVVGVFVAITIAVIIAIFSPIPICSYSSYTRYPFDGVLRVYLASRLPDDPTITVFGDDSRLAQTVLGMRNRIDFSEREFTREEIEIIIGKIQEDHIWLLFERGEPHLDWNIYRVVHALQNTGRGVGFDLGFPLTVPLWEGPSLGSQVASDHWMIHGYVPKSSIKPFQYAHCNDT